LIIDFKWETYTKSYYLLQFLKQIVFIVCFLTDITILGPDGYIKGSDEYIKGNIATRTICLACVSDFLV
jgi:hypothetical protein